MCVYTSYYVISTRPQQQPAPPWTARRAQQWDVWDILTTRDTVQRYLFFLSLSLFSGVFRFVYFYCAIFFFFFSAWLQKARNDNKTLYLYNRVYGVHDRLLSGVGRPEIRRRARKPCAQTKIPTTTAAATDGFVDKFRTPAVVVVVFSGFEILITGGGGTSVAARDRYNAAALHYRILSYTMRRCAWRFYAFPPSSVIDSSWTENFFEKKESNLVAVIIPHGRRAAIPSLLLLRTTPRAAVQSLHLFVTCALHPSITSCCKHVRHVRRQKKKKKCEEKKKHTKTNNTQTQMGPRVFDFLTNIRSRDGCPTPVRSNRFGGFAPWSIFYDANNTRDAQKYYFVYSVCSLFVQSDLQWEKKNSKVKNIPQCSEPVLTFSVRNRTRIFACTRPLDTDGKYLKCFRFIFLVFITSYLSSSSSYSIKIIFRYFFFSRHF